MAAAPDAPAPLPPLHGAPLALLTVAIAFATFMEVLDITIVNVSVPHIAGSLGVSPQEGTWAISSYSLASAIMQPLSGWIGRRFVRAATCVRHAASSSAITLPPCCAITDGRCVKRPGRWASSAQTCIERPGNSGFLSVVGRACLQG